MPKLKQQQFYCVKCKAKRTVKAGDICVKVYRNKRMYDGKAPSLRSECPKCGTNLTKFIKHDSTERMQDKYGKC